MNVLRIGNVPSHCPLKSIDRYRSANGGGDAGCRDYFSSNLSIFPGEHAPHCPSGVPAFDGRRLTTPTFKGKSSVRPCQKVTRDYNTDRIKITINGMLWHTTCCAPSHFQGNGASQTPPPTTLAPYDMPPRGPLWEKNTTSSTKPEVQNISERHRRRTDPRPQVACTENVMKSGRMVPEIFSLTGAHRQTHRQTCSLQYSSAQSEVTNQHKGGNSETIEGRRIWQLNDFNLTTPLK